MHGFPVPLAFFIANQITPPVVILTASIQVNGEIQYRTAAQSFTSRVRYLTAVKRRLGLRDIAVVEIWA